MKKVYIMPALLVCVLLSLGFNALAAEHTAYFVGWKEPNAYVWGEDPNVVAKWPGTAMTKLENVNYGGMSVYKYDFAVEWTPTSIIFNTGSEQTADLTFSDNGFYILGNKDVEGDKKYSLKGGGTSPQSVLAFGKPAAHKFYVTGADAAWSDVYAFISGSEGIYGTGYPGAAMTLTDKYYNGKPVYEYTFETTWVPAKVTIGRGSDEWKADVVFAENALYELNLGTYAATTRTSYTFDTEVPPTPTKYNTLYMDFGADRQTRGKGKTPSDFPPKVILLSTVHTGLITGEETNTTTNVRDMVKVSIKGDDGIERMRDDHDLWSYTLTEQELPWVKDVIFYFPANSGGSDYNQAYCCGMEVKDKGNLAWDKDNWLRYMYFADNVESADGGTNQGKATQSYITFDQYKEVKWSEKPYIYFIGDGLEGFNEWKGLTTDGVKEEKTEMNVAYLHVKRSGKAAQSNKEDGSKADGILFKMSWLKPYDWWQASGKSGGEINEKRAWATFNYGIIGFDTAHPTRVDRKLNLYIADDSDNMSVHVKRDKSYPVNNSNQYNWFIAATDEVTEAELVIDLDPECQSATLLAFQPNPTVEKAQREVTQVSLTQDQIDNLHTVEPAKAAEANGAIAYDKANLVSARLTVLAAHHNDIKALGDGTHGYTIEYQFFTDGEEAGVPYIVGGNLSTADNTFDVVMLGLNAFEDTKMGVRALYTYNHGTADEDKYKIKFHSRYLEQIPQGSGAVLPHPAVGDIKDKYFVLGTEDDSSSLGIFANIPLSVADGTWDMTLARYIDFELASDHESDAASQTEIMHKEHNAVKQHPGVLTPYAVESVDGWASTFAPAGTDSKTLPLVLTHAYRFDEEREETVNVSGEMYFIFPTLSNPDAQPTVPTQPASAPRRAAEATGDYAGFDLKLQRTSAPVSFSMTTGELTGIADVALEGTDAPAEYYDLRGVRMSGPLAPGMYIRRQGKAVTKVMVQ